MKYPGISAGLRWVGEDICGIQRKIVIIGLALEIPGLFQDAQYDLSDLSYSGRRNSDN